MSPREQGQSFLNVTKVNNYLLYSCEWQFLMLEAGRLQTLDFFDGLRPELVVGLLRRRLFSHLQPVVLGSSLTRKISHQLPQRDSNPSPGLRLSFRLEVASKCGHWWQPGSETTRPSSGPSRRIRDQIDRMSKKFDRKSANQNFRSKQSGQMRRFFRRYWPFPRWSTSTQTDGTLPTLRSRRFWMGRQR